MAVGIPTLPGAPDAHPRLLTALQARYRRSDAELKAAVTNNFQTKMFNPQKAPLIYVGNQENPTRRRSFTVLGIPRGHRLPAPIPTSEFDPRHGRRTIVDQLERSHLS